MTAPPSPAGPPAPQGALVSALVAEAATRGERALSAVRGAFCLVVLARFVAIGGLRATGTEGLRAAITVSAIALAVGVSGLLLVRSRRRSLSRRELTLSAATDAAVCFAALLPNVLWPWPGYQGLFAAPDAAALLVVAVASGFRLHPAVTLGGGALHGLSFACLAALDVALQPERLALPARHVSFFAILLFGAAALAVLFGKRALALARASAARAAEAERARHALTTLLQEHHDVRSFLSSATLSSDVMLRDLARAGDERNAPLAEIAADLREDLLQMHRLVNEVKERAYLELATLEGPEPAEVAPVAARVAAVALRRFPGVRLDVDEQAPGLRARVIGGAPGLERVLLNLVVNACEGDGARAAQRVTLRLLLRGARAILQVDDDGPGFPADLLTVPHPSRASTKTEGSGLGLLLTSSHVEASGGALTRENLPQGGARVSVELSAEPSRG